ncbi:hypothetical protein WJ95_28390 [Burkholderia ubonensis]|nr:hypothetical protein WJ95_28390 [Burkholderia ubonensis]
MPDWIKDAMKSAMVWKDIKEGELESSGMENYFDRPVVAREAEAIYTAEKLIEGIGIRLLRDVRTLPEDVREIVLSMESEDDLDMLMNTLYRPQILVPKGLTLNREQYQYLPPTS